MRIAGDRIAGSAIAGPPGQRTTFLSLSVTQNQSVAVTKSSAKRITTTQGQTVSLRRMLLRSISLSQHQAVALTRAIAKQLSSTQGQSISLRSSIAKAVHTIQGQAVVCRKAIAHRIAAVTQGQSVTIFAQRAFLRHITVTQSQIVSTPSRVIAKRIATLQGQTARLRRSIAHRLATTQSQTVTLRRLFPRGFAVLQGQIVRTSRVLVKRLSTTQPQQVAVGRSMTHRIIVLQSQIVHISKTKFISIAFSATQGQIARLRRILPLRLSSTQGQIVSVIRNVSKIIQTAQLQLVRFSRKVFKHLDATPRYISHFAGWVSYVSKFVSSPVYIATTRPTNMPQAKQLPPIDAARQDQTITLDFGDGPYLPDGVTLTGTPTVNISVDWGDDPDPNSRISATAIIGTAPKPYGSGRANCAVLFQLTGCPGPLAYLIECECPRTDNDVATMDVILPVRVPPNQ